MSRDPAAPLKIGLYADKFQPGTFGGVDSYFVSLVTALARHAPQHTYTVLAQARNVDLLRAQFGPLGVRVHLLNTRQPVKRLLRGVRRLIPGVAKGETAQINALDFDVISFPRNEVYVRGLRAPVALHLFDIQYEYYPQFFPPGALDTLRRRYRESVARADLIVAAAEFSRQTFIEKLDVSPDRVTVVYPGVPEDWRTPTPDEIAAVRARYGLPDGFLFYPANPWNHKNHARLLAALRVIREQTGRRLPVVFTGRLHENSPANLQQLALAARVDDQVFDLGFVPGDDLPALYGAARFMVFPSLFEGFGLPLLEAMARGCPVACADATCLPEIAQGAALLFDPLDVDAIAAAVLRLWDDDALRADLRAKGLVRAGEFSWQAAVQQLLDAYQRLAARA